MSPRICHVSLMNPAIHSRIFFKEALSQRNAGYEVSIIGRDSATKPRMESGVQIIPIPDFARLSLKRMMMRSKVDDLAVKQKADLYVIHSPELFSVVKKIRAALPGAKIIYDVHEDYYLNIRFGGYYPSIISRRLSHAVRQRELDLARSCDGLMLAEDCFTSIFEGIDTPAAKVRNKFQKPPVVAEVVSTTPEGMPVLVSTGTIAEAWGTFHAIDLWAQLNRHLPVKLIVAGHTQNKDTITKLLARVKSTGFSDRFQLIGGNQYVPFEEIIRCIAGCTASLALYQLQENIRDRIPTKFYECMAFQKPLFFTSNPAWNELNERLHFGVPLKETALREQAFMITEMLAGRQAFPVPQATPHDYAWEEEEKTLLDFIKRILLK